MSPLLIESLKKKTGIETTDELIDDFYRFCQRLYGDSKYKESVLFATLFYYYLEKKKQKKKSINR